jgi:PKD repeat protein
MIKKIFLIAALFVMLLIIGIRVYGQTLSSSKPMSSLMPSAIINAELLELKPPDVRLLLQEDKLLEGRNDPVRMGVSMPVYIKCSQNGNWEDIPGGKLWIKKIRSKGAAALGLYFSRFFLPEGCIVHVYDSARIQLLGAFTKNSNPVGGLFAAGIVPGETLFIECFCPDKSDSPEIIISEVLYVYRPGGIPQINGTRDFGASGPCEVNINCEEGLAWQDAKHGVLRILVKIGGSTFWCTGSLINNTRNDFTPYIITADHCAKAYGGATATPTDLLQWIFYFNFESEDCANPAMAPALYSLVGATKLASNSVDSGSDFYLAMLNQNIPGSYKPYFNGWDRSGNSSNSGVTIHHPWGDIKKISIYNTALISAQYIAPVESHWEVFWHDSPNGHGVTEPGSSGSPIFDEEGHILGCLTGGGSSCDSLYDPDYYGKFSFSWESNGSADSLQLKPWLDPDNTGIMDMRGIYDTIRIVADFSADHLVIPVGTYVTFTDRSTGIHSSLKWSFEGAEPATSDQLSPQGIYYSKFGAFDVQMIASSDFDADTIFKKNYIRVIPKIYPNPTDGIVKILSGNENATGNPVSIYNRLGQLVYQTLWPESAGNEFSIDLARFGGNVFFISYKTSQGTTTDKVILIPKQ